MKKIYFIWMMCFLLGSCNSRYSAVPSGKITSERKKIAQDFIETYLKKCENRAYSELEGFNISNRFQKKLSPDSIKKTCAALYHRNGKITVEKFVSAHTINSPRDFMDVFNFKIKTEKSTKPVYFHLGMYRDQNYIEFPFYISADENYYETIRKKYYKK